MVWCVKTNDKADMALQTQARLIDMLTVGKQKGKIWANVLILNKGVMEATDAEDCRGPVEAARKTCPLAQPRTLGYKFAREDQLKRLSSEDRMAERILTREEALERLERELAALPPALQVVFADQQCRACGQVGDQRLMEDFCHKAKVKGHTDNPRLKKKHSKPVIGAAYAAGTVGVVGLGAAAALVPGGELLLLGAPMVLSPGAVMTVRR